MHPSPRTSGRVRRVAAETHARQLETVAEQTQFMMARAQGAMEKILKTTPESPERDHIVTQFTRIVHASENFYPLINYINFKGEGTNPNEAAMNRETGRRNRAPNGR
jgi:hypothetical protein